MHRVSWNSFLTSPSCPSGSGRHYPELILVVFSMSHCLSLGTGSHFLSSRQRGDLERSILSLTAAIFLPIAPDAPPSFINIVEIFYNLALFVLFRIKESWQPEDVKCSIQYFRYLHRQWHEISMKFSFPVTTALVHGLAVQVLLKLGDVDEDIEEMAGLCDELLNSDIPIQSLKSPIADFAKAISRSFEHEESLDWKIRSEKVTDCLRKAIVRLPGLHEVSIALTQSLYNRFVIAPSDDDYEEGMELMDRVLTFRGSGGEPSPYREKALYWASLFAEARFKVRGKPEHLGRAIYLLRAMLDEDLDRARTVRRLSILEGWRTGNPQDLLSIPPESGELPSSFQNLIASLPEAMAVPPNSETLRKHFQALHACSDDQLKDINDIANIEDGIKYCRHLLISCPHTELASTARIALGCLLHRAFQCTQNIGYLDEAISDTQDGNNTGCSLTSRVVLLLKRIEMLMDRLKLLHYEEDLDELMQLFPIAAGYDYKFGDSRDGHWISCIWAAFAHRFGHPSTSTAYDRAISLMQASLTFAPTLDGQHSRLVAMRRRFQLVPLAYASYNIDTGHLERAIEILEQGRCFFWSEMRGLRTSIDQIRLADANLADNFSTVNRKLETLTLAFSPNNNVDGNNDPEGMDSYGHTVIRKQKLLDNREKLISQIQALPGLDTFLKPPSFDTLRSAASHGPIIIINHCEWRSDILILLHDSSPSLIPTSKDFYIRANKLQDQLLGERRKGLESDAYEDALRAVLKELYELVGRPVIKRLNELNIPEQSRVWWCPTSAFCSLPLHAMGPILSEMGPPRYFLDLYIPSYTPSLSTLVESHKPNSQPFEQPSMLLIVQPDASMVRALDEMKAVQGACPRATTLIGVAATPSVVLECLQDHRFVHIVCHGMLEPGKPFDSSFKLYRGKRLSLLDIVQSQAPNAEFAFLAACHTAELTDKSPTDEALHLAAAMQYCGFRSVVGTMWAMADEDGRDLAENFYKSVFSGGEQGVCYHERTAEALRDAVVKLRRRGRGMSLERWVNYVHYGA